MSEPAERFEVHDKPVVARRALAAAACATGMIASFAAIWNLWVCAEVRNLDLVFLCLSAIVMVGGVLWWFLPSRPPRLIVSADRVGLTVPKDGAHLPQTIYESIPRSRVRDVRISDLGDGFTLEIETSFPPEELQALKDRYGATYTGSVHTCTYSVPVLGFRKRAEEIMQGIEAFRPTHTTESTDMSNKAMQGTITSGAPLARSRP